MLIKQVIVEYECPNCKKVISISILGREFAGRYGINYGSRGAAHDLEYNPPKGWSRDMCEECMAAVKRALDARKKNGDF